MNEENKTKVMPVELESKAIALFKEEWVANGFSTTIPLGGDKMPRRSYSLTVAAVVERLVQEYNQPHMVAIVAVLMTSVGNSSQLGAKLLKGDDAFLKEAGASETADSLIAAMQARLAKK